MTKSIQTKLSQLENQLVSLIRTAAELRLMIDSPEETLITMREAADYAHVAYETLRKWVQNGLLRASRGAGKYLIDKSDLDRFLNDKYPFGRVSGQREGA